MTTLRGRVKASALFWPLPPLLCLTPAGLILALTLAGTWSPLSWRALDWVYLSGQVGAQARLPVVVAAGTAALVAARFTRASLVFAQPWQPRMGRDVPLRHALPVTGWCLGAYLVGLIPLTVAVATHGAGVVDPLPVLGALAGFVALTLLGYLCGLFARGLFGVPVAIATVFVLTALPMVADPWTATSLQLPLVPFVGMRESVPLGSYRLGFFLLTVTIAAWTAAWFLRVPRRFSVPHMSGVVLLASAALLPHLYTFPLLTYAHDGDEVCSEHDGIRYCVHEGHADELALIIDLAAPVFAAHGQADALPNEVRDHGLATGDSEVLDGPAHGVLWMRVHPGWDPYQQVPGDAAAWLVPDLFVCGSEGVAAMDRNAQARERRAAVITGLQSWLASRAFEGETSEDGLFADADPDEVRAWIARSGERLSACEVEPEELPWWP